MPTAEEETPSASMALALQSVFYKVAGRRAAEGAGGGLGRVCGGKWAGGSVAGCHGGQWSRVCVSTRVGKPSIHVRAADPSCMNHAWKINSNLAQFAAVQPAGTP